MSAADKIRDEHVEVQVVRLFAGREPSEEALARCPTLQDWRLHVRDFGRDRRRIVIEGRLTSDRFKVKDQPVSPMIVLWMDRKQRFVLTTGGLKNLGARERDVDKSR
jgi:hypothetical protein